MSKLKKRIAFVSLPDSSSKTVWSGTPYFMAAALENQCAEVIHLGPITSKLDGLGTLFDKMVRKVTSKRCVHKRTRFFSSRYSAIVERRIKATRPDFVFSSSATTIAYLGDVGVPVIHTSDATFASIYNYYPGFENYQSLCLSQAHEVERKALARADLFIYPSDWAAKSAINEYGVDASKVHVVPYGANLESWPEISFPRRDGDPGECRLLFIGVDWNRKGGNIALQTMIELDRRYGMKARLSVVGCRPPAGIMHESMDVIGYLDKRDRGQQEKLLALIQGSDYLLLPTRAECYGLVFCEASAYGLPSITTDTGGVRTVVKDGVNGCLLPLSAGAADYAEKIYAIETQEGAYDVLSRSSRQYFEEQLNWRKWGDTVAGLLDSI